MAATSSSTCTVPASSTSPRCGVFFFAHCRSLCCRPHAAAAKLSPIAETNTARGASESRCVNLLLQSARLVCLLNCPIVLSAHKIASWKYAHVLRNCIKRTAIATSDFCRAGQAVHGRDCGRHRPSARPQHPAPRSQTGACFPHLRSSRCVGAAAAQVERCKTCQQWVLCLLSLQCHT